MNEQHSTNRLMKYSGVGLVTGAAIGMFVGMVFGLEYVGPGLIFGALGGIVFGPTLAILNRTKQSNK